MGTKRLASELEPRVEGPNTFDELSSPLPKRRGEASTDKNALPLEAASRIPALGFVERSGDNPNSVFQQDPVISEGTHYSW